MRLSEGDLKLFSNFEASALLGTIGGDDTFFRIERKRDYPWPWIKLSRSWQVVCAEDPLTRNRAESSRGTPPAKAKFTDRPFVIQGRYGLDTLVGIIGMTASVDVENHLAIGVGVGTNLSGRQLEPGRSTRVTLLAPDRVVEG